MIKLSWNENTIGWSKDFDAGKELGENQYKGPAGPQRKQVSKNDQAVITFLERQGVPYKLIPMRSLGLDVPEDVQLVEIEKDGKKLRIGYDRWGYVVEGDLDYEVDQGTFKEVTDTINRFLFERQANQLWPAVDTQITEPEDRTYVNPIDDIKMRRENEPGYNKRRDWYNYVNEDGNDSEVSLRNEQTSLTSGASWKNVLSDYDPAPGFIPTNKGMQTEEDIFDSVDYSSYAANRDYDKDDPDYDPETSRLKWRNFWMKHAGWSEEKLNKFEKRYKIEGE